MFIEPGASPLISRFGVQSMPNLEKNLICPQRLEHLAPGEPSDKSPLTKALTSQRTPRLLDLPRKIFTPAPIHQRRDVIAHHQFIRQRRLLARVDDDWAAISQVMSHDVGLGSVDIAGRFKARPG